MISAGQVYRDHRDSQRARRLGVHDYAVTGPPWADGRVLCEDLGSSGNCFPIIDAGDLADPAQFEYVGKAA